MWIYVVKIQNIVKNFDFLKKIKKNYVDYAF